MATNTDDPAFLRRLLRDANRIIRRAADAIGESPSLQLRRDLSEIESDARAFGDDFHYLIETAHVSDDRSDDRGEDRDRYRGRYEPIPRIQRRHPTKPRA